MSYSQVMATIEVSIDIEDLGITDFDDLTDKQLWILLRAYDALCKGVSADPLYAECEMNFDLFDPNDLEEKYGDRYEKLCAEKDKEFADHDEWVKGKEIELGCITSDEMGTLRREASIRFHKIVDKWHDGTGI